MAAHVRLARRRAQQAAALSRSAQVENLMHCQPVKRLDIDLATPQLLSRKDKPSSLEKRPVSRGHAFKEAELMLSSSGQVEVKSDFRTLCRRLRKLPLRQLGPSLPMLHAQILERAPMAVSHFWSSVSRRVLVNSADFPLLPLAYALPELQRTGHLAKVSSLGKLVRGLARQAALVFNDKSNDNEGDELAFRALLPKCCQVLHLQLALSKPRVEGCWAGRLHRMLTRGLPPVLAKAPPGLVIPWLEFYAQNGLVDHDHLSVWEAAGENLRDAFLSYEDEHRLLKFQDQVPLWIAECLPQAAPRTDDLATLRAEEFSGVAVDRDSLHGLTGLTLAEFPAPSSDSSALSPPMYQKSPPVPVLWHTSPENYQRGLSRLGARQLVLALRYAAVDGAGTLTTGAQMAEDFPARKAMVDLATGIWPKRHRSRSRAQAFVATLLTQLTQRISGVKAREACSVVKSLASLKRIGLANSPEAGNALRALISGPLAGWKVAMSLTPSDVSLLLPGIASLVAGGTGENMQAVQAVARASMEAGSTGQLLNLAACALQEAGAPHTKLRAMCGAAAALSTWHRGVADQRSRVEAHHAMQRFLNAAAAATKDGPHTNAPQLAQPLAVLRAAGDAGAWSSDVFANLAPMVTELIFSRPVPRVPGYTRDWRPFLPRPGYTKGSWKIEELAETAWLYSQSSSRRPLEGQTALALSLALLVHLPILQATLIEFGAESRLGRDFHESLDEVICVSSRLDLGSVDSRLLMFACDASRILRCSAEVFYFQPWSSPKVYLRKGQEDPRMQTIEHLDLQMEADMTLAKQVMWKWKSHVKFLDSALGAAGARRRVRAQKEIKDAQWLSSNVLSAYSALEIFDFYGDARTLTRPATYCLWRAFDRQSLERCSSLQARSQLRSCLRRLRTLKRKQPREEMGTGEAHVIYNSNVHVKNSTGSFDSMYSTAQYCAAAPCGTYKE